MGESGSNTTTVTQQWPQWYEDAAKKFSGNVQSYADANKGYTPYAPAWNAERYLAANPDVAATITPGASTADRAQAALNHYNTYGASEGRTWYSPEEAQRYQRVAGMTGDQNTAAARIRSLQGGGHPIFTAANNSISMAERTNGADVAHPYFDTASGMSAYNTASPLITQATGINPLDTAQPYLTTAANANGAGTANPWVTSAMNTSAASAASPLIGQGTQTFTGQNVANYMSPYTQQVTDRIAQLGARNLSENLLPAVNDTFIGSGQFGGSRNADFTNRAVRDANESILGQQAQALESGYSTAGQLFGQDQGRALQGASTLGGLTQGDNSSRIRGGLGLGALAEQDANRQLQVGQTAGNLASARQNALLSAANLSGTLKNEDANRQVTMGQAMGNLTDSFGNRRLAAGQAYGNLGTTQQNADLAAANALSGIGTQQQALDQQHMDLAYQDFQNQRSYPRDLLTWQSSMLRGTNPPTDTTTTSPGPSTLSQIAGLGLAGGSLIGGLSNWFSDGGRVRMARGGLAMGYADGGDVDTPDWLYDNGDYPVEYWEDRGSDPAATVDAKLGQIIPPVKPEPPVDPIDQGEAAAIRQQVAADPTGGLSQAISIPPRPAPRALANEAESGGVTVPTGGLSLGAQDQTGAAQALPAGGLRAAAAPSPSFLDRFNDALSSPVTQFGFGLLASRNPRFLGSLGEAGQYASQQAAANKQRALQAQQQQRRLDIEQQNADTMSGYRQGSLGIQRDRLNRPLATGRPGVTQAMVQMLMAEDPSLSVQQALAIAKDPSQNVRYRSKFENLALTAARNDPGWYKDQAGTLQRWRQQYGLLDDDDSAPSLPAATAPTPNTAGAATAAPSSRPTASATPPASVSGKPPAAAIQYLKKHPEAKEQFDAKYGSGSAASFGVM